MSLLYSSLLGFFTLILLRVLVLKKEENILSKIYKLRKYEVEKTDKMRSIKILMRKLFKLGLYLWIFLTVTFIVNFIIDSNFVYLYLALVVLIFIPLVNRINIILSDNLIAQGIDFSFIIYIGAVVLFIMAIVLTITFVFILDDDFFYTHTEDTNGTINELNTLVIEDNVEDLIIYTAYMTSLRYTSGSTGASDAGLFDPMDYNGIELSYDKMSGFNVVLSTKIQKGVEVEFNIHSVLYSGNCRMIVVDSNWDVIDEIPFDSDELYHYTATELETIRFVLVAESAKLEITIDRDFIE